MHIFTTRLIVAGVFFSAAYSSFLEAAPGDHKWLCYAAPRDNVQPSTPTLDLSGQVYVSTGDNLTLIDALGGSKIVLGADGNAFEYLFECPPIISPQNYVFFATETKSGDKYDVGRRVFAVDFSQPKFLWYSTQEPYRFEVSPCLGRDGTVYAVSQEGILRAYRGTDGQRVWTFNSAGSTSGRETSPIVGPDGTIYYARHEGSYLNYIYAVHPDGSERWSCNISKTVEDCTFALSFGPDNQLYASTHSGVYALDAVTGGLRWYYPASDVEGDVVVDRDGTAYFGSQETRDNCLRAVDANGHELWRFSVGQGIRTAAAVAADGTIYFGTYSSGYLVAIRREGGQTVVKWKCYVGSHLVSPPVIGADGTVFCSTTDGFVHAIYGSAGPAASVWPMARQNAQGTALAPTPPAIRTHPMSVNAAVGGSGSLSAEALSSQPLTYQWFKDGQPVPGATQTALNFTGAQTAQSGFYYLEVSNYLGQARSEESALTVGETPLPAKLVLCSATNGLQLRVLGTLGRTCHVEVRGSLGGQSWQDWKTFTFGSYAERILAPAATSAQARFYRVRTLR